MSHYPFENLSDEEFEDLVIRICKEFLGISCSTFSKGRDGGKDSWFTGTAQNFPSKENPWSGDFCIQAKHTSLPNASCSDNDFYKNRTSILSKEIIRLQQEMQVHPFENYILFTNRKHSGGAHPEIIKKLQDRLGIANVKIFGKEDLNAFLTDYPHIAYQFGLHRFAEPLRFRDEDLRDIIIVFSEQNASIMNKVGNALVSLEMMDKEEKNRLNNLNEVYFEYIKSESLQYFKDVDSFLKSPQNVQYMRMYSNTINDLQARIILNRDRFDDFMHIIENLVDFVVGNNESRLRDIRKIVRVFVHFMYFNCDIGRKQ